MGKIHTNAEIVTRVFGAHRYFFVKHSIMYTKGNLYMVICYGNLYYTLEKSHINVTIVKKWFEKKGFIK